MYFEQATLDAPWTCTISTEISAEKGKPVRYMPGCESACLVAMPTVKKQIVHCKSPSTPLHLSSYNSKESDLGRIASKAAICNPNCAMKRR